MGYKITCNDYDDDDNYDYDYNYDYDVFSKADFVRLTRKVYIMTKSILPLSSDFFVNF